MPISKFLSRLFYLLLITSSLSACRQFLDSDSSDHPIVKPGLGTEIDQYMSRLETLRFSGALLVAKDGDVILAKGYGLADRERHLPVTTETVFTIGSITKQFTAAAIMKLEMEGKLSVDDPITKYFDNVPADKAGITLHHLLTHSAGLRSDYGSSDFEPVSREEFIRRVLQEELLSPPGERYEYSNAGYSLLGAVIEKVTHKNYEQYLNEALFKPAGMLHTGYKLPQWDPDNIAQGYRDGEKWGTVLERPWAGDGPYWNLRANGGIHSTIGDMYKWHLALSGDSLLSAAAKQKIFTPYIREGEGADSFYGYGWAIFETPRGTRLIAHNGGNGIFAADFRRYVDENVVYFIASNAGMSAIRVSNNIARIVFGMPYTMPPEVVQADTERLARYAGTYELSSGERLELSVAHDHLEATGEGDSILNLLMAGSIAASAEAKKLNARVSRILDRAIAKDFAPLYQALGGQIAIAEIEQLDSEMWRQWEQRYGKYKSFEVLGSHPSRFGAVTLAKINFERGETFLRYVWEEELLAGIRPLPALPTVSFWPVGENEFVSFDLRRREGLGLYFKIAEDGSVIGLRLHVKDGDTIARRIAD